MNKLITTIVLMLLISATNVSAKTDNSNATISNVINTIKFALKEAQDNNIEGFPDLTKVKIKLQSKAQLVKKKGFKFFIISLGSKKTFENTSSIQVELSPPKTTTTQKLSSKSETNFKIALAFAINGAKISFLESENTEPKLNMNKITIVIQFAVTKEKGGSADSLDLIPIGLSGTKNVKKSQVHTVELTFGE